MNFEETLQRLEAIVKLLEDGQIGLTESLQRYEEGIILLNRAQAVLEQAQRRIEVLSGVDAEGHAITQTLPEDALSLDEKAAARSRRRSTKSHRDTASPAEEEEDAQDDMDGPQRLF